MTFQGCTFFNLGLQFGTPRRHFLTRIYKPQTLQFLLNMIGKKSSKTFRQIRDDEKNDI